MNASDLKELINTIFEGLISLVVIAGSGYMITSHPDSTAVVGVASGAGLAVVTFWFGQRATTKAVNGNITALANIAGQMVATKSQVSGGTDANRS